MVYSPGHARQQLRGLEQRLLKATEQLQGLTPAVGRGKRQIRDLTELQDQANRILKAHRVEGLLDYHYEFQPAMKRQKERYQITHVLRLTESIESTQHTFGWRLGKLEKVGLFRKSWKK